MPTGQGSHKISPIFYNLRIFKRYGIPFCCMPLLEWCFRWARARKEQRGPYGFR